MGNIDRRTLESKLKYEGKKYKTNDGEEDVEVVEYRKYSDVTARIVGTDYTVTTNMGNIKNGINNPFTGHSPIGFLDNSYAILNSVYATNEGYHIKLLKSTDYAHVNYIFLDSEQPCGGQTTMQNIRNGEIRNPFKPNSFGGYLGLDITYRNDEYEWLYRNWTNMLIRGHEPNREYYNEHHSYTTAYDNTIVCPEWLNYSNYAKWYMEQYNSLNHKYVKDYVVDKDLLYRYYAKYTNNKKCYGPQCCELIPKKLNNAFSSYDVSDRLLSLDGRKNVLDDHHIIKITASDYFRKKCLSYKALQAILEL